MWGGGGVQAGSWSTSNPSYNNNNNINNDRNNNSNKQTNKNAIHSHHVKRHFALDYRLTPQHRLIFLCSSSQNAAR